MLSGKKVTSTIIALSMTFSAFSALFFAENASAAIINEVNWTEAVTENFEGGQKYIEKSDSGLRTASDKDGDGNQFSTYENNSGESLGKKFKRLEQGSGIAPTYIQTRPSLVSGYDTSGTVRIDFDMAKSWTSSTVTVIGVQGNITSGTSNTMSEVDENLRVENEQWLFSFEDGIYYGYDNSSWPEGTSHGKMAWDKFSLIVNCATDKYDVYRNGTKIINGYGVGVNFSNIDSFKVVTKPSGPSGKKMETLIDNIRFYVGSSSSGWTQVFYEDFEDDDMKVIDKGESGYRTGSDTDGNGTQFSGYTNNSGDSFGTRFMRIAQGNSIGSGYIQTRPSLTSGYDTSGKVKFEFDMAKSNTDKTTTVIAVQGDRISGTSSTILNGEAAQYQFANEQWLFSVEEGDLWAWNGNDWTNDDYTGNNMTYTAVNTWEKYTLIIDTDTDTYDMYINDVKKASDYVSSIDFGNIDSLKIVTKVTSNPTKAVETLVDNIGFYKETAPGTWTEIFFEDFEASDKQFIESGNSGYRLPADKDGNGKVYNTYPNAMGINVGTQFKRIEQGNGAASKYIQTDPALLEGYDTSVLKVEFDMAMTETWYPETIIAIQGDASGSTNSSGIYEVANEQWLFSIVEDQIWAFDGSDSSWPDVTAVNHNMKEKWYHFKLVVDCDTDTYDVWYNNDKVVDGLAIGRNFSSIDSFKIVTKQTPPKDQLKKYVETALDNIVISVKDSLQITGSSYADGELTAAVSASGLGASDKLVVAAYDGSGNLTGSAIVNAEDGVSAYNASISGLGAEPSSVRVFVWSNGEALSDVLAGQGIASGGTITLPSGAVLDTGEELNFRNVTVDTGDGYIKVGDRQITGSNIHLNNQGKIYMENGDHAKVEQDNGDNTTHQGFIVGALNPTGTITLVLLVEGTANEVDYTGKTITKDIDFSGYELTGNVNFGLSVNNIPKPLSLSLQNFE